MKNLIALLLFAPTFAFALNCGDLQVLDYDAAGNPVFKASGVDVEIVPDASGVRGLIAVFTEKGAKRVEKDVEVSTVAKADVEIEELVQLARPDIAWADVVNVEIGNVGVKANLDDAGGMLIYALKDASGVELGKVLQIGWGFGKCTR